MQWEDRKHIVNCEWWETTLDILGNDRSEDQASKSIPLILVVPHKNLPLPLGHLLLFSRILREFEKIEQQRAPLVTSVPNVLSNSTSQSPCLRIQECDCCLHHCSLFCSVHCPLWYYLVDPPIVLKLAGMNCWVCIQLHLYCSPQYPLLGSFQKGTFLLCILYLAVSQMYANFDSHRTSKRKELFRTFQ